MYPKFNIIFNMELALVAIATILCSILLVKLLYKLRSILIWRVNCWFCNNNFWMKYVNRNNWTCPKCEQYNGFTKDGDYNKTLFNSSDQTIKSPKVFQTSPPRNGLCKMCNINQQLKVVQLANFVPMNEKKFDEEIESYKAQLEKAYKLCNACRKVLQLKLHKEKEILLGTKLLENRTPDKRQQKQVKQKQLFKATINNTSMFIAGILVIFVSIECYLNALKFENLPSNIRNIVDIMLGLIDRIVSIIKMKTILTFPSLEKYFYFEMPVMENLIPKLYSLDEIEGHLSLTQKALGGFVCLIQIIGHLWNINKLNYTIIIDLLWSVFVFTSIVHQTQSIDPIFMSLIKLTSVLAVLLVYKKMKNKSRISKALITPVKVKNLINGTVTSSIDEEDNLSLDTDDDISLCKFGLHSFTDSSHETICPQNTVLNGRSFTPRNDNLWNKPKHNSTFCVNSVTCKSPSSVSDNVFIKPSFDKYQKLSKDDSDSELDESISTLCIGSPRKNRHSNSIFTLRKFTATPCFVAPTPLNRARPLISPSKLGHSTSWVAGGYWGSDGERQMFNIDGSRSSSQSSGFESQASSLNQRNVFSQPPSREESICSEPMAVDNCRYNNQTGYRNYQVPQTFSHVSSPVYPQMQYNSYVHIPQPRFAQQNITSTNIFAPPRQGFVPHDNFKTPGGSGLIKLPQVNSFSQ
ncbi:unnamed protein product [Diatraea saccharalis]|uniref:Ima1 N-terminal domain-containing protein n=1 Tax=Diatraea saccharalis TaxID=40085 RepID=A0A9N9QV83_9NEOP|nr:unnamed protein product [Diatraea saccharalis]